MYLCQKIQMEAAELFFVFIKKLHGSEHKSIFIYFNWTEWIYLENMNWGLPLLPKNRVYLMLMYGSTKNCANWNTNKMFYKVIVVMSIYFEELK